MKRLIKPIIALLVISAALADRPLYAQGTLCGTVCGYGCNEDVTWWTGYSNLCKSYFGNVCPYYSCTGGYECSWSTKPVNCFRELILT